jgi:hypothetical protein
VNSHGWIVDTDGSGVQHFDYGVKVHQTWFTKQPDYTVDYMCTHAIPDCQYHINPFTGEEFVFRSPQLGHWAYSPLGRRVALTRAGISVRELATGEERSVYPAGGGHLTWSADPDWFSITSSANELTIIYPDHLDWFQRICAPNTMLFYSNYWGEAHGDLSPDGTKVGYGSNMLGDIDFYMAIVRRPDVPTNVASRRTPEGVEVTWQPGKHSREIAGYHVFRAEKSAGEYRQLTADPVAGTRYLDADAPAAQAAYVVTAIEHSSLESRFSEEARVAAAGADTWQGPVTLLYEAEEGDLNDWWGPWFLAGAGNDRCAALRVPEPEAPLSLVVSVPASGSYALLARVRTPGRIEFSAAMDGQPLGGGEYNCADLTWLSLTPEEGITLSAGEHILTIASVSVGLLVDQVCLTSDLAFGPSERLGVDCVPPEPVTGLRAEATREFDVTLAWQPCGAPGIHHYNVYCREGEAPGAEQEFLVLSPSEPRMVDWGLQAGTEYHYQVTAVDRQGNESLPSEPLVVSTKPIERVLIELPAEAEWPSDGELEVGCLSNCPPRLNGRATASLRCPSSCPARTTMPCGWRLRPWRRCAPARTR